ncbi:MAG: hypothetical protein Q4A43_00985 [Coriobacteriia bacterium]|nr:hypothetical protein [Coriobacteriia bacterium]
MSEEQNNQQAPQSTQPVGSFDPNAASYVPNSAAYNEAQQAAAQQTAPAAAPAQPVSPEVQAQPYVQGATGQAPQAQPYQQVPAGQAQPGVAGAAVPQQPYQQGAPAGQPYQQPYQQGAPAGNPYQQAAPNAAPTGAPMGAPYQQPYQQNPYQPAAGMPTAPVKSHSTSTLVLGILAIVFGFVSPLVAWILGGISLHFAKKDRQFFGPDACKAGRTCAIVGIVIGVVMWAITVFLLLTGYADADVLLGSSSSSSVF